MGHARGARAIREAIGLRSDPEVCAGILAVQLGQLGQAAEMYESSGRHDLLNELRQAKGEWGAAIALAEEKACAARCPTLLDVSRAVVTRAPAAASQDRIHLRSTHYSYARALEAEGKLEEAIEHYEKAGAHRTEVPRMLFDAEQTSKLQEYVDRKDDAALSKWWAQYCESNGAFDKALDYYQHAKDHLATVRILCFHNKLEAAAEVVAQSSDAAAAYHLAKACEERGQVKEAVQFFQRAGRSNHAVRLAKEHGMASELRLLAQQAPPKVMAEAAEHLEQRGMFDQAIQLYSQSGNMSRALDLCFKHNQFEALREIADHLSADADPALLRKVGDFFLEHGQFDKAVRLFSIAGETKRAIELCTVHNVPISEELAERLCPELGQRGAETEGARQALLLQIAKCCKRQGNYHLACKKYTQAGDKVKGMRCLLKSGDTDKIVFFAGVSRAREIYILAANYLQNLDWHSDAEILKNIVAFYNKGKAFESLSAFYDMCAQVEIDEYRDYEKAASALNEALTHMGKARNAPDGAARMAALQSKIAHVTGFVAARKMVKSNPDEMIRRCHALLGEPDCEEAIRVGDVFALMIEWFYSQQEFARAHALIEQMRDRSILLSPYLDSEMIQEICAAMGVPPPPEGPSQRGGGQPEPGGHDDMDECIEGGDDDE